MKRSDAAKMIDKIRVELAERASAEEIETMLARHFGVMPLEKCEHEGGAFQDGCSTCAPRWGWTGEGIKIT